MPLEYHSRVVQAGGASGGVALIQQPCWTAQLGANHEIRNVAEFFTALLRWVQAVLAAGTVVVGGVGSRPGAGTKGGQGLTGVGDTCWACCLSGIEPLQ
jgi:hypothetical protein